MEQTNYQQKFSMQFSAAATASSSNSTITVHREPEAPSSSNYNMQFSAAPPSFSNNYSMQFSPSPPSSSNNALVIHNEPEIAMNEEDYFNSLPHGFRFCPYDKELIEEYLKKKVYNEPLPPNKICEVNIYSKPPWELTATFRPITETEWYFFTSREKKYRNGTRPNRSTSDKGYWKPTGTDKGIYNDAGQIIGFKKTLDYLAGKHPNGVKTHWKMHEYRLVGDKTSPSRTIARDEHDMTLDKCILCRIYKKRGKNDVDEGSSSENVEHQNEEASALLMVGNHNEFEQQPLAQAPLQFAYHQANPNRGLLLGAQSSNESGHNQVAQAGAMQQYMTYHQPSSNYQGSLVQYQSTNLTLLDNNNNGFSVHQSFDHAEGELDYDSVFDGLEDLDQRPSGI